MWRISLILYFSFFANNNASDITRLISKKQFENLFPNHRPIYSYENLVAASKKFPKFANDPDEQLAKRELIAFFANISHETSSGWAESKGGVYAWGLSFVEEEACKDGALHGV